MYYIWRLLGYSEEECTYRSEKEIKDIIEFVDTKRAEEKEKVHNTRYATSVKKSLGESLMLKKKFREDLEDEIKLRWHGVKGLDARQH